MQSENLYIDEPSVIHSAEMNIFLTAKLSEIKGMGYRARKHYTFWKSKKCSWCRIFCEYGIRWSDKWQLFPIWNVSHNSQRALSFGFWKLYFEIGYYRENSFNQKRKYPFRNKLWNFYQLFF